MACTLTAAMPRKNNTANGVSHRELLTELLTELQSTLLSTVLSTVLTNLYGALLFMAKPALMPSPFVCRQQQTAICLLAFT